MVDNLKIKNNVLRLKKLIAGVWLVVIAAESAVFPEWNTIIALVFSSVGLWLCGKCVFTEKNLLKYPVSTIAIVMYPFFFMFLPPIATMLELKPVTYNLHSTLETYFQMLVLFSTLIVIHSLYRRFCIGIWHKKILVRLGYFRKLSTQELWVTIIISLVVYVYSIYSYGLYDENMENTRAEMPIWIQAVSFVFGSAYSIVFVFYMKRMEIIRGNNKVHSVLVCIVVVITLITGIATNMRTASIVCFSTGMFIFIVYDLYYPVDFQKFFSLKKILLGTMAVWFFTGPFMDISNAMLLSRGDRYGKSGMEVLEMTLSHMGEAKKERSDSKDISSRKIYWDEEYLDNHILNRFCSIKILDESLFHAHRCGYSNPIMRETLLLKICDDLPGPVKDMFGVYIPNNIRSYSLTDKMYTLSVSGAPLGGVKIGTLQGLGLALWGWWYILILAPVYFILFFLLDSAIFIYKGELKISYWFLFNVVALVYWFSDRHYYQWEFRWIMRTFWESTFFFLIYIKLIKNMPFIKH